MITVMIHEWEYWPNGTQLARFNCFFLGSAMYTLKMLEIYIKSPAFTLIEFDHVIHLAIGNVLVLSILWIRLKLFQIYLKITIGSTVEILNPFWRLGIVKHGYLSVSEQWNIQSMCQIEESLLYLKPNFLSFFISWKCLFH